MWDLQTLPFPIAENMFELVERAESFDNEKYYEDVAVFFKERGCVGLETADFELYSEEIYYKWIDE